MTPHRTRLVVVLGAGGVGKTTSAAALAMAFAEQGLRSVVVTVDPAKRLAQALGLESLSDDPREVARFGKGSVHALWLDTRSALQSLVKRTAGDTPMTQKILNNRLFRIVESQLGGVEEYLGVEKVLALKESGQFDVCVLDTPPARHALDFLEAPKHLLRFFDEGVLRVFLSSEPEEKVGFFSKILRSGRAQALEVFKNFLGKGFLGELGELLAQFRPVYRELSRKAERIEAWLRSDDARFVVVGQYEPYPLQEARLLSLELGAHQLPGPHLLIVNKCLPVEAPPAIAELRAVLGEANAKTLIARHAAELRLRATLSEIVDRNVAVAEVLRYSVRHLSQEQLLEIGRTLLKDSWTTVGPTPSTANS